MALSNPQYESIIKKYERQRDAARDLSEARRKQVCDTIPGFRELSDSVSSLSVASARQLLDGDQEALPRLHRRLKEISASQRRLLAEHGFPPDYLDPVYRCAQCQDTGYVLTEKGLREKCRCFRQQEISLLYAQSHIQEMVSSENFSTLSYGYYQGEDLRRFEAAVRICQKFVENSGEVYQNLFFYGTVGTGKSFLSGCIADELLRKGCSVLYFSASGLFETLARHSFDPKSKGTLQDLYEDLHGCDLLIIDDLGTEVTNSFVTSQLFSCLCQRHLGRKSTLISTNINLEELRDRYSDRIFSRVTSGFTLCRLTGPDIRILKKRLANTSSTA